MRRDTLVSDGRRRGASLEINWDACLKASESEAATVMKSFTLKPSPFWGLSPHEFCHGSSPYLRFRGPPRMHSQTPPI